MAEEVIPDDLEIADELIAERRQEKPGETPEDMTPWQRPITGAIDVLNDWACLLYTSPSPRDYAASRMPSSA